MRFTYCPDCGSKLSSRVLGDEGAVPWCDRCNHPWFDVFPVAAIMLVYNDRNEVLLLRQGYISTEFHNLVSGYVTPGENAQQTAIREVKEETGLDVTDLELVMTDWFPKKEMMMISFFAKVADAPLKLSTEVDSAAWYPAETILPLLSPNPHSTSRHLAQAFLSRLINKTQI